MWRTNQRQLKINPEVESRKNCQIEDSSGDGYWLYENYLKIIVHKLEVSRKEVVPYCTVQCLVKFINQLNIDIAL